MADEYRRNRSIAEEPREAYNTIERLLRNRFQVLDPPALRKIAESAVC